MRLLAKIIKIPENGLGSIPIGCDNQEAVKLIESGMVKAKKSKHIFVKQHHTP
jgi:hypothetical protein